MNTEQFINNMICEMSLHLGSNVLKILETTIRSQLRNYKLEEECTELSTDTDNNEYILKVFVANKKLENASDKSIKQYVTATRKLFDVINKNYSDITTNDIKYYLATYKAKNCVSSNTVANAKRFISAFFSWACDEEYIPKNPCHAIKNIKQTQKKKQFLSHDEEEAMRYCCTTIREKAMFEFLLSTGLRVSELSAMNRQDIDFKTGEVNIYGQKTRTYRTGYLTSKAKLYLQKYLLTREDDNEALFVTQRKPHNRIGNKSIETELQEIAKRAEIEKKVTVHLIRKTFATRLNEVGAPITVIKELLGHANINVTEKNYVTINQSDIISYHNKIA